MSGGPVLVTGASGLLGHWLLATRPGGTDVVALVHRRSVEGVRSVAADLRDPVSVADAIAEVRPSLVVHAAYAKDRPSIVDATRHVVDAATAHGCEIVFTSSDAVFDGDGVDRDERAEPDAEWDYGRWKADAERIVSDHLGGAAVVRLPLLVSVAPDDTAVAKMRAGKDARAATTWYVDEFRRPALASEVASAMWRIVELPRRERGGVWHLAGPERLSRYDIATRMATRTGIASRWVEPGRRPVGSDRPGDIAFTDARARAAIAWDPGPIG